MEAFGQTAARSVAVGFQVLEIHAAHGYLLHEFLLPLSNQRTDEYGGSLNNRARALYEVVQVIRSRIPEQVPLFVRVSATDWTEGGLTPEDVVEVVRHLKTLGVGFDRLFGWRERCWSPSSGRTGIPDSVCGRNPARGCYSHGSGRPDYQPGAGRPNYSSGPSGSGFAGSGTASRSLPAASCSRKTGRYCKVAVAISSRCACRIAAQVK